MPKFSVIIMAYNEEQTVIPLYYSLKKVMDKLGQSYEIIFVNDGSTDKSPDRLRSINLTPADLIIVDLDKHRGQSTAMQAGFDIAQGEFIITMDADLQNDPEDIPRLWDKLKDGYDAVCGWRYNRKDPRSKVIISHLASFFLRLMVKQDIHDFGCSLRILRKEALKNVYLSKGMHRFFILLMLKLGYKIGEVKVNHRPRRFGQSKYNIHNRLFECLFVFLRISLYDVHNLMEHHKPEYKIKVIRK
ncbi:MAG: glycosyltransferase family 2 protein [Candidatus Omnitrophica bacterium]|nr:glycosyltransferase family 2 protein [Candidatus Omnitrophota bacterium]MBU4418967.1 glycosyltransferase family 2 protein [Candidatus Omnitrophota bacterium]MBU4467509.1 glycosyltransferase family 2 protein [Candidatus Omnitrophota bacterium]MCG2713312.1 glycosyltransferase family 2 protein [Candidatus Omnitrophota bacterium]